MRPGCVSPVCLTARPRLCLLIAWLYFSLSLCAVTMMSHLTGRPLRDDVAVVGELRLSGHLDPVSSLQVSETSRRPTLT